MHPLVLPILFVLSVAVLVKTALLVLRLVGRPRTKLLRAATEETPAPVVPTFEMAMPSVENGAPKELIDLAAQLSAQCFAEVHLRRETLTGQPVGWILWASPEEGTEDAVTILASHATTTTVTARIYQNQQPLSVEDFHAWTQARPIAPTSQALVHLFTTALRNEWSASMRRRREGSVHWLDLHAEATSFTDRHAAPVVFDILHNGHTGIEDMSAYRNTEPVENISALDELNQLAPGSLPTATMKGLTS